MRASRRSLIAAGLSMAVVLAGVASVAADERAGVEVNGAFTCSSYWQAGTTSNVVLAELDDGSIVRREERGFSGRLTVDHVSDVRLDGEMTTTHNRDEIFYHAEPVTLDRLMLSSGLLRIEGEVGSWQGDDRSFYLPGTWDPEMGTRWEQLILAGEGAYAGLLALLEMRLLSPDCYCWNSTSTDLEWCQWELRGVILEGDMPPSPSLDG